MSVFPVIDSTLSAPHLSVFLIETYGLSSTTTCRLFRTGINHTYMVSAQDRRYVFRVYSYAWRTETEINEEIRLLNLLRAGGVSVSYPVQDVRQAYLQRLPAPEGTRYAVLFSFAEGRKIRELSPTMCTSIGAVMGKMHALTARQQLQRISYQAHTMTQLPYQYARQHFAESLDEMQFIQKAGAYLTTLFSKHPPESLRTGIVHLDIWYDNMSILDEQTIILFDFDFCGNGWLVLDVAYFVMQLYQTTPDKEAFATKADAFYAGYQQETTLSDTEKKLIPNAGLAIWIFYLGVQSQRFDNWSNIFLTENYLKHYVGLVKKWLDHWDITLD